ncbi:MAG: UDP-N-acetylmuramoyl-tripeptide--D-alanyl-D-alanine ligase [Pseudanabaenaceae cyanobacterium bins.68]|nr:UDP-N-acetylmuramoyl-tripeptide--D-alanyl-D-alanine ligase [Pseudanabaenaceae cyanobacterium bins.68]
MNLGELLPILAATGHTLPDLAQTWTTACTDTRKLQKGDLFFALSGEHFDGHDFAEAAIAKGAVAVVGTRPLEGLPQILVDDALGAYQALAKWWRLKSHVTVIGITGSAGKTTTKEIVAAMLACYAPGAVHKSVANFNNDIGVAQTLLEIQPHHRYVVLEMGMRGRGEIARLAQMAQPNVGLITNIGTAHIGRLGSQQAIAEAKTELLANLAPDQVAILNGEDDLLLAVAQKYWQGRTITYGIERPCNLTGKLSQTHLTLGNHTFELPLAGRHNALNCLAGFAVLEALGLPWQTHPPTLANLSLPNGRAQVINLLQGVTILDQTYNASPEATIAALKLLAATPAARRWAILGANRELGEYSWQLHYQIGQTWRELGIDRLLVLTDPEAEGILAGAELSQPSTSYQELLATLLAQVQPEDCLLFKASNSVGMGKLVQQFCQAFSPVTTPAD